MYPFNIPGTGNFLEDALDKEMEDEGKRSDSNRDGEAE